MNFLLPFKRAQWAGRRTSFIIERGGTDPPEKAFLGFAYGSTALDSCEELVRKIQITRPNLGKLVAKTEAILPTGEREVRFVNDGRPL